MLLDDASVNNDLLSFGTLSGTSAGFGPGRSFVFKPAPAPAVAKQLNIVPFLPPAGPIFSPAIPFDGVHPLPEAVVISEKKKASTFCCCFSFWVLLLILLFKNKTFKKH